VRGGAERPELGQVDLGGARAESCAHGGSVVDANASPAQGSQKRRPER